MIIAGGPVVEQELRIGTLPGDTTAGPPGGGGATGGPRPVVGGDVNGAGFADLAVASSQATCSPPCSLIATGEQVDEPVASVTSPVAGGLALASPLASTDGTFIKAFDAVFAQPLGSVIDDMSVGTFLDQLNGGF